MSVGHEVLRDVKESLRRLKGEIDALVTFNAENDVVTARDPVREKELVEIVRLHQRLEMLRAWGKTSAR